MTTKKQTGLNDLQLGGQKGKPSEVPVEAQAEKEAEKVPEKKLHEFVIEKIQECDEIEAEVKEEAIKEINFLKETKILNDIDLKNASMEFGSALGSLFVWSKSTKDYNFWNTINKSIKW